MKTGQKPSFCEEEQNLNSEMSKEKISFIQRKLTKQLHRLFVFQTHSSIMKVHTLASDGWVCLSSALPRTGPQPFSKAVGYLTSLCCVYNYLRVCGVISQTRLGEEKRTQFRFTFLFLFLICGFSLIFDFSGTQDPKHGYSLKPIKNLSP